MNSLLLVLLASAALMTALSGASEGRGYTARPCGFDMNRNGVIGEPADCHVGDGVTADPDGDGVDEHILYVDSACGSDETGTGSSDRPYKTIQKALDVAPGPEDGVESIICISGVFHESLVLKHGGVPGYYARDGFQFPRSPLMIIGWDKNRNGQYPPYDRDDVAVLDGQGRLPLAIDNGPNGASYIEIAHLTIQNYGCTPVPITLTSGGDLAGSEPRGAIRLRGQGPGTQSHIYIHDVEFRGILKNMPNQSAFIVVSFAHPPGGRPLAHVAVINTLADEFGSYFVRGWGTADHYRFQSNTLRMYGVRDGAVDPGHLSGVAGFKLWGENSDFQFLDNIIDGNVSAWRPKTHTFGIGVCQDSRHWVIRGNEFRDLATGIVVQPYSGPEYYKTRSVTDIVIDGNTIRNSYAGYLRPPGGISLQGGPMLIASAEDIRITNNFLFSGPGWDYGIHSMMGNDEAPQPGTITIAGNTIYGPILSTGWQRGGIVLRPEFWDGEANAYHRYRYPQNHVVIKGNIIAGIGANANVDTSYAPDSLVLDGNVYDPSGGFVWCGEALPTPAAWQKAVGQDGHSKACTPAFRSVSTGDLHLMPRETCAHVGVDITPMTAVDIDGDARPSAKPVAGADVPAREE